MNHDAVRFQRAVRIAAMHVWLALGLIDLIYRVNGHLGGPSTSPYRRR